MTLDATVLGKLNPLLSGFPPGGSIIKYVIEEDGHIITTG